MRPVDACKSIRGFLNKRSKLQEAKAVFHVLKIPPAWIVRNISSSTYNNMQFLGAGLYHFASFLDKPVHLDYMLRDGFGNPWQRDVFQCSALEIAIHMENKGALAVLLKSGVYDAEYLSRAYRFLKHSKNNVMMPTFVLHAKENYRQ
jgi:hypothetical protein